MASLQPSRLAQRLAGLLRQPQRPPTIAEYNRGPFWKNHRIIAGLLYAALLIVYGVAIGMTGRFYLLQLAVPLIVLAALVIWALPDAKNPPTNWIVFLLFAFIVALLSWPDYLAFAIPGLPWITAIRLVAFPLALVMLICLSVSRSFRAEMLTVLNATPLTWKMLVGFTVIAALSIAVSSNISLSVNKFIVAQLYWTLIFFGSAWVFIRSGRATLLAYLIWGFAIYVCAIGILEWRMQALPWAGRIPSFLVVEDPAVQNILAAKARAATGIYRVQSKFTTPLGLAEFLGLMTPIVLYFLIFARHLAVKLAALASLPLILYTILLTDSRLGFVGFSMSFLLFLLAWAIMRWMRVKGSIFGPAVTLGYPAVFLGFIASTFLVGRIRALVWGTGAHSFSTEAREDQVANGIPMILSQPWGYGIGRGAEQLGYTNLEGTLTIDSYYLLIGLEFGVIGFLLYFGMFVAQICYAMSMFPKIRTMEQLLLIPLMIALTNFVIIKSIFAQQENHPLIFAILGAMTALVLRVRNEQDTPSPQDHVVFERDQKTITA